jgi:hypothetical protein
MTEDATEKLSKRFGSARSGVNVEVNIDGVAAHLDDVAILHGSNHADHHGSDPKIVDSIQASPPVAGPPSKDD